MRRRCPIYILVRALLDVTIYFFPRNNAKLRFGAGKLELILAFGRYRHTVYARVSVTAIQASRQISCNSMCIENTGADEELCDDRGHVCLVVPM